MPSASATSSTPRATPTALSPRFSRGKESSPRTVPMTTCVSGSWKSVPTARESSAGPLSRSSIPQISARPAKVPPWKCGTSPLAIRSSVDLPEAEAPARTANSPCASSSVTSSSAGVRAPG